MEWIFDGIGTEILLFILGLVTGVVGYKFYINKQTQKAGEKSVQIQIKGKDEGNYSATQIENVIAKGNNATLKKWCLELIINQKQEYLILLCIKRMDNDKEKYKLLEELSKRNFEDSEYFAIIGNSLSNGVYITKAIELYISIGKTEYIKTAFALIENNKYVYKSLIIIYEYNKDIFKMLYDNGNCFDNTQYKEKIICFLNEKEHLKGSY